MADTKITERADSEMTLSDELREAAAKLRMLAAGATPGRWVCGDLEEQEDYGMQVAVSADDALTAEINLAAKDAAWRYMRNQAVNDGQWIALASPALAEPLASWLESWDGVDLREDGPLPDDFTYALRVARVLNGTAT
ncbi:hypothetical protein ACWEJ6_21180 [Nonomuraea sp. NPDC004702]